MQLNPRQLVTQFAHMMQEELFPLLQTVTGPLSAQMQLLASVICLAPQLTWAQQDRYKERTMSERVNARLKGEFGASRIRVRGGAKVMAHLMFGVLALTVDQWLRMKPPG